MEDRDRQGRFQPGNPGRPKGAVSGRRRAVQELDRFLAEETTLERLHEAFRVELNSDPIGFWQRVVRPLLPSQALLAIDNAYELERLGWDEQREQADHEEVKSLLRAVLALPQGADILERIEELLTGDASGGTDAPIPS